MIVESDRLRLVIELSNQIRILGKSGSRGSRAGDVGVRDTGAGDVGAGDAGAGDAGAGDAGAVVYSGTGVVGRVWIGVTGKSS